MRFVDFLKTQLEHQDSGARAIARECSTTDSIPDTLDDWWSHVGAMCNNHPDARKALERLWGEFQSART